MRRFGLLPLLAGLLTVGPALSGYFLFFESGLAKNSTVHPKANGAPQAPAEGSASVVLYRVSQLEAQQNQAPSRNELTSTQQQPDELLAQATEQLKASQERFAQAMEQVNTWRELFGQATEQLKALQGELISTRQQADELREQLGQATEQLKASQDRVGQLEAQLKQAPSRTQQEAKSNSAGTSTTPSCEAVGCSFALSPRADPGAAGR